MHSRLSTALQCWLPTLGALVFMGAHFGCGSVVETPSENPTGSGGAVVSSAHAVNASSASNIAIAVTNVVGAGGYGPVTITATGSGGGTGTSVGDAGGAGVGGGAVSLGCSSLCAFEATCAAGAPIYNCLSSCAIQEVGACGAQFNVYLNCARTNRDTLSTCGVSSVCDAAFSNYRGCVESQSMTDAAAMGVSGVGAGAGGGAAACQGSECFLTGAGPCTCTQVCGNETLSTACSDLPGGAMCGCTEADVYLGSCFDPSSSCGSPHTCCDRFFTTTVDMTVSSSASTTVTTSF